MAGMAKAGGWKAFLVFVTVTSLAIGIYAVLFQLRIGGDPTFHERFDQFPIFSTMHVIGGAVVLLLGAFQFWTVLRRRYPAWHRWAGRIYLTFVAIGSIGGLGLAPYSSGGIVAHYGFGVLAVLWAFSGWQAYASIRRGDVQTHKAWMLRNFAMAFGAVTLRVYIGLFTVAGVPFSEFYPLLAWLSWVPNLILVEWWMALQLQRTFVATAR